MRCWLFLFVALLAVNKIVMVIITDNSNPVRNGYNQPTDPPLLDYWICHNCPSYAICERLTGTCVKPWMVASDNKKTTASPQMDNLKCDDCPADAECDRHTGSCVKTFIIDSGDTKHHNIYLHYMLLSLIVAINFLYI